jgi:hypothetical protein
MISNPLQFVFHMTLQINLFRLSYKPEIFAEYTYIPGKYTNYLNISFLDAFAELTKEIINFVMCICQSVC